VEAGVTFGDVLADGGYGVCAEFRRGLSAKGLRWIVGVSPDTHVYAMSTPCVRSSRRARRADRAHAAPRRPNRAEHAMSSRRSVRNALWTIAWRRGTKGMLSAEFTALRVRVADGEPVVDHRRGPGEEAWLIFDRRASGETKYHLSNYPPDASFETLVAALKARWACEQAHQQMKEELGLDHFEGRSWSGLHHHALLTMIAFAFLQHLRRFENKAAA
jgi:SRSO17 transposase